MDSASILSTGLPESEFSRAAMPFPWNHQSIQPHLARLPNRPNARRHRARHHFLQRRLKLFHLRRGAYGYSRIRGPYRPDASDVDVLAGHGVDHFLGRALGVEHEAVRLRGNVRISVAIQPREHSASD